MEDSARLSLSLLKALEGSSPPEAIVVSRDVYNVVLAEFSGGPKDYKVGASAVPFRGALHGINLYVSEHLPLGTMFMVPKGDRLGLANPVAAAEQAARAAERKPLKVEGPYADIKYIDPRDYRAYTADKVFLLELDPMGAKQMVVQCPGIEWKEIGP